MGSMVMSGRVHSGLGGIQTHYGRHGFAALTAAIDFHLLAVAAYFLSVLLSGRTQPVTAAPDGVIVIRRGADLPGLPKLKPRGRINQPRTGSQLAMAAITIPLPVMVEDSQFAPDVGIQNSPTADSAGGASVGGEESTPTGSPGSDVDQGERIFKLVDQPPVPIRIVKPEYPDIARRMALEGVVWVNALVEKDGRVTKATVLKSTNDMFNDRSVQAALLWVFVPGMMSSGPVRVWTSIPFRFSLVK
jgi:protein TonB